MAVEKFRASERSACGVIGQDRSAFRKKKPHMGFQEAQLRADLSAEVGKHPARGWRTSSLKSAPHRTTSAATTGLEFTAAAGLTGAARPGSIPRSSTPDHPGRRASSNPSAPNSEGTAHRRNHGHHSRSDIFGRGMKAIYNHERPRGSLDGMTPKRYWENWTQENLLAIA